MKICAECKNQFEPKRKDQKYCSEECRKKVESRKLIEKYQEKREKIIRHPNLYKKEKECVICNKKFIPDIRHPLQQTCGLKCSKKLSYLNNKKEFLRKCRERYKKNKEKILSKTRKPDIFIKKTCLYCNKEFKITKVWLQHKKFCDLNCKKESEKDSRRKYPKIDNREEKECIICGKKFTPLSFFHPNQKYCDRKCRAIAISNRYRRTHPEKIKEYVRRPEVKERMKLKARGWREKNPERVKEIQKVSYRKNLEKRREEARKWAKEHPENRRINARIYEYKRKAKIKIIGEPSKETLNKIEKRDKFCVYCGALNPKHRDHIIPLRHKDHSLKPYGTNDIDNFAMACNNCNSSKQHLNIFEWCERRDRPVPEVVIERLKRQVEKGIEIPKEILEKLSKI